MSDDLGEQYIVEVTEPCVADSGVSINDFYAYMPQHSYIFTPCREFWAAASINARVARIPVLNANGRPKRSKGKMSPYRRPPGSIKTGRWSNSHGALASRC